jgi:hypothetical protein
VTTSHEKYDEFFPLLHLGGGKILLVFLSDHNKAKSQFHQTICEMLQAFQAENDVILFHQHVQ